MDGLKQGIEEFTDEWFSLLELENHKLAAALVADLQECVTSHVLHMQQYSVVSKLVRTCCACTLRMYVGHVGWTCTLGDTF